MSPYRDDHSPAIDRDGSTVRQPSQRRSSGRTAPELAKVTRRRVLGALAGSAVAGALGVAGHGVAPARALPEQHSPGPVASLMLTAQDAASPEVSATQGTYLDPAGRFSLPVPPNWTVEEYDAYVVLRAPDGDLTVAAAVATDADAGAGIISVWRLVDPAFDPAASEPDRLEVPSDPGVDQTVVLTYDLGQTSGRVAQAISQRVGDQVYVLIFRGDLETVVRRQSQINVIVTGFRILATTAIDLSGRRALPLEGDRLRTFAAFASDTLAAFGIPGAAVAVVQGGAVTYRQGFGVTREGGAAVTPDTLMMIGSVTKSFTTMLMGTLIDAGLMDWDQPVVEILPSFRVADPELTPKVTMRDLVCACIGVPRRDAEIDFNSNDLTAEGVIASIADFPFSTPIGEAFQYSNQMVAAAGYIAALADGGRFGDLSAAYAGSLGERILDPIGMSRSTFDLDAAARDRDHAFPHGITLAGDYQLMPPGIEAGEGPIAPAAGMWSSAAEMALYVRTELGRGIGPTGKRVVSAGNLEETWAPHIAITATVSYGLGWEVETWKGLRVIRHGGNTRGFASDVAFLPDADVGIVTLTNAQEANVVTSSIRQRLFELLLDQPSEVETLVKVALDEATRQRELIAGQLADALDPAVARTLTGAYRNPVLGPVIITYADGALTADAGEFRVALRLLRDSPPAGPAFIVADPPFVGRPVRFDTTGAAPRLVFGSAPEEYIFERIPYPATPVASPAA